MLNAYITVELHLYYAFRFHIESFVKLKSSFEYTNIESIKTPEEHEESITFFGLNKIIFTLQHELVVGCCPT